MPDDTKIKYSAHMDVAAPIIDDIIPENLIRVFPYEMPNSSKSEEFVGEQTTSIVYITQTNLDIENNNLKKLYYWTEDTINGFKYHEITEEEALSPNGEYVVQTAYYFEMFAAITSEGKLDISAATSTLGKELKEEDSFSCLSNWYYESELDKIKLGNARLVPAVFTIGLPFRSNDYKADRQHIFIASSMIEAKLSQSVLSNNINTEGIYEFQLMNITTIESSFINSKIIFNNEINALTSLKYVDANGDEKNGFKLEVEPSSLISKVMAKGKNTNGEETDIDFEVIGDFTPFKMTPVAIQDKVSMFADWFDTDVSMPIYMANKFLKTGRKKLNEIITDVTSRRVLEDMLALSYAFANQFADFDRYTTADVAADSKLSNSDVGKIKSNLTIGNAKIPLSALESKDAIKSVDSVFETYIRETDEDSAFLRDLKLYIVALSRFIYSNFAVGQGQNSYHQAYLPWYLTPTSGTPINLTFDPTVATNYILNPNINFKIKSKWFDVLDDKITFKKDIDISNIKLVQTDRKLTIPELPYTITAIDKLLLPGDVDTKSGNSLAYMFYLPIADDAKLQKLFLSSPSTTTDNSGSNPIYVSYGPTIFGQQIKDVAKTLIEQAAADQGLSNSATDLAKINYQNDGVVVPAYGPWGELPKETAGGIPLFTGPATTNAQSTQIVVISDVKASDTQVETDFRNELDVAYSGAYELRNIKFGGEDYVGRWVEDFDIRFIQFTASGHYIFKGSNVTINVSDRETLFDKVKWIDFLRDNQLLIGGSIPYQLTSTKEKEITEINEIIIYQIWGGSLKIWINLTLFEIELFNSTDETIGAQRIIFT